MDLGGANREALALAGHWLVLGLPTPEEVLGALLAGEVVRVEGHSLQYDAGSGVTWATSPYGVDSLLFSTAPDLARCRALLMHLALGGMVGAEP